MKRSELAEYIKETIVDVLSEATPDEVDAQKELNKELEKTVQLSKELSEDVDDDTAEPTSKDISKKDSISVISRKLQDTTKEMKSVVNQWKKAEGEDKARLLTRLKELTKIKKELEGLI